MHSTRLCWASQGREKTLLALRFPLKKKLPGSGGSYASVSDKCNYHFDNNQGTSAAFVNA
jgi:hypothetical protein